MTWRGDTWVEGYFDVFPRETFSQKPPDGLEIAGRANLVRLHHRNDGDRRPRQARVRAALRGFKP
jgi:hypothetical protein